MLKIVFQDQLGIENEEENQEAEECKNEEVTLEVVLQKVGLADKIDIFHKEQIDLESLVGFIAQSLMLLICMAFYIIQL